nr:MAG TPA: hypothetical protein [Caudoviricetes sp.]
MTENDFFLEIFREKEKVYILRIYKRCPFPKVTGVK